MSIALLAPLGLAALATLVLPIVLHLVRRLDLQTTDFAALRWIGNRVRPRRRLHVDRPWLLVLRLALLGALALLLAQPVWTAVTAAGRPWVVVAPTVSIADARAVAGRSDAEWHWLSPGFPLVDTAPSPGVAPTASLLRELDADLPAATPLSVVVPADVDGLDGERVRLHRTVEWHVAAGAPAAGETTRDSGSRTLVVRASSDADAALPYLRAAVAAWNTSPGVTIKLDIAATNAALPADASWIVLLGAARSSELDAWIEHGGTALVASGVGDDGTALWRDAGGRVLARTRPIGSGRLISVDALTPTALPILLDATFPAQLLEALRGSPPAPTRATAAAVAPVRALDVGGSTRSLVEAARPLDTWLAFVIALLFLAERFVATRTARSR